MNVNLIAPCYFGLESTLAFEVRRLGAENVQVTDGRVTFSGSQDLICRANLNLRTAERVMMLLYTGKAETFDELFDSVYSIPWEEYIPADGAFPAYRGAEGLLTEEERRGLLAQGISLAPSRADQLVTSRYQF